jgi:hypothetical protein
MKRGEVSEGQKDAVSAAYLRSQREGGEDTADGGTGALIRLLLSRL